MYYTKDSDEEYETITEIVRISKSKDSYLLEFIRQSKREKLQKKKNNITTMSMYRALQFQITNDFAYGCTAGDTLLTVMENGDLVPCRRMPIIVGNLLKDI